MSEEITDKIKDLMENDKNGKLIRALITGGNIGKIFKSKYEKKGEKDV